MGLEGSQAELASDYAIPRFRSTFYPYVGLESGRAYKEWRIASGGNDGGLDICSLLHGGCSAWRLGGLLWRHALYLSPCVRSGQSRSRATPMPPGNFRPSSL